MIKFNTYHCMLDLSSSRQEKTIIAENCSMIDGRIFFYIGNRMVADLPYDKTFIIKVTPIENDLVF